jgi:hypothetical protein
VVFCSAAAAVTWQHKFDIATIDTDNYAFGLSNNKAHVVYETGGNVYYASRGKGESEWTTRHIGSGSAPSMAVSESGNVYIAYNNGGTIYETSNTSGWNAQSVAAGNYGSIDLSENGTRHLLIEGNADGDGYNEISYASNTGSGWSSASIIQDGWYEGSYRAGNYYNQSSLAARSDGSYVYGLEISNWGGQASWSEKAPSVIVPGGVNNGMSVGWNTGSQLSRKSVACGDAGIGFVFSTGGSVYTSLCGTGGWTSFVNIGAGSQASIDVSDRAWIAYMNGGNLMLHDGTTSGTIDFEGTTLTGYNPFIKSAGEDLFLLYRDTQGKLTFAMTASNDVPEPGSLVALAAGMTGLLGFARRRKLS